MRANRQLFDYLLRLADNGLVLAQRLGEWVGKGPVLEEDIASANVALDLLVQARLWLAYAGESDRRGPPPRCIKDQFVTCPSRIVFRHQLFYTHTNHTSPSSI